MPSLELFVIGHEEESLKNTCKTLTVPHRAVNVNNLGLKGDLADNSLSESRFFLSDVADSSKADFVGCITYRYDEKFKRRVQLNQLGYLPRVNNTLWAPYVSARNWLEASEVSHKGLKQFMSEIAVRHGLVITKSFWCNNFIVRRDLYERMLAKWREMFWEVHNQYGLSMPFDNTCERYNNRVPGLLYERFTMAIFPTLDPDLQIHQIP
jgi:hypothetical protein